MTQTSEILGTWQGIFKIQEETGELNQELGKLAVFPHGNHPDGNGDLVRRVTDEIADTLAAIEYFIEQNGLDNARISKRKMEKLDKFNKWGLNGIIWNKFQIKGEIK